MMPTENWIVACTIRSGTMLGTTCSAAQRAVPLPAARAAITNSDRHTGSAPPRATRAKTGTLKTAMAITAFHALAPNTAAIISADRTAGKAKTRSLPRMMASSIQPPRAAAIVPRGTPIPMPIRTAAAATASEVRAPTMSIESVSRPK